jgi:hypothetical protein
MTLARQGGSVVAGASRLSVTDPGTSLSHREADMDAAQRLRLELTAMARGEPEAGDKLREAVCAFVDEMKSEGKPAEAVIIAAKQVAAMTGLLPMPEQDVLLRSPYADRVITDVVRWCIERFYDAPARSSLPAPPPS